MRNRAQIWLIIRVFFFMILSFCLSSSLFTICKHFKNQQIENILMNVSRIFTKKALN